MSSPSTTSAAPVSSGSRKEKARSSGRLSCRSFAANAVRLQLHALAYNLGNFLRTLATPEPIKDWSLTSLKEKLIKIGAKVVTHGRYVAFQMAEVAVPRMLFVEILRLIAELRPRSPPIPHERREQPSMATRGARCVRNGPRATECCRKVQRKPRNGRLGGVWNASEPSQA